MRSIVVGVLAWLAVSAPVLAHSEWIPCEEYCPKCEVVRWPAQEWSASERRSDAYREIFGDAGPKRGKARRGKKKGGGKKKASASAAPGTPAAPAGTDSAHTPAAPAAPDAPPAGGPAPAPSPK